jgi:hypothetical protein
MASLWVLLQQSHLNGANQSRPNEIRQLELESFGSGDLGENVCLERYSR